MGDFEKKFPASAFWKKKIVCSTNDIKKNSCTAASKEKKMLQSYCWFSHDVTKFQTSEPLILLRFYLHDVLEQLKTNIQTNFHSEWVLGLVIDYA